MITRILVPTDFSEPSDQAFAYANSLANRFGAAYQQSRQVESIG